MNQTRHDENGPLHPAKTYEIPPVQTVARSENASRNHRQNTPAQTERTGTPENRAETIRTAASASPGEILANSDPGKPEAHRQRTTAQPLACGSLPGKPGPLALRAHPGKHDAHRQRTTAEPLACGSLPWKPGPLALRAHPGEPDAHRQRTTAQPLACGSRPPRARSNAPSNQPAQPLACGSRPGSASRRPSQSSCPRSSASAHLRTWARRAVSPRRENSPRAARSSRRPAVPPARQLSGLRKLRPLTSALASTAPTRPT
jgi:hypothetical protein